MKRWQQVLLDETAASSVEYGLLLAGIALVVFASIMTLGQVVLNRFYAGADKLFQ
jgi:Flp pilus assembly pilin Flp